jgi:hypothetical protein
LVQVYLHSFRYLLCIHSFLIEFETLHVFYIHRTLFATFFSSNTIWNPKDIMFFNFISLTAALATTASADCHGNYFNFFNRPGSAMSYQRVDPALQPGTASPHMHSFDGGNSVSANTDFAATQSSTCTTARIKTDKSLYWRPTLYWNGNGTGYHRVPEKSTKIYYKFGDGDKWANVTGFPEDFNMIAGDPKKRSLGDNPAGVQWGCHGPNGRMDDKIFEKGFPTGFHDCSYGFATEVTFPSCWNGKLLDPKNPYDHMAYPNGGAGVGIENCPTTHRAARFPTIFIEFWYDISPFNGTYADDSVPWVLSNGDPTGYSFHADFLNGWEKGVLEKAIAETGGCNCGCGCGQEDMEQCFGKANVNVDDTVEWEQCSGMDSTSTGEAAAVVETLPGCNPIQSGPADATAVSGPGCSATAAPPVGGGNKSSSSTGATKTPVVFSPAATPTEKASSKSEAGSYASSSQAVEEDASTYPSPTPNKVSDKTPDATQTAASSQQYGNGDKQAAKPTPNDVLPSLVLVSTPAASKPTAPAGGEDESCKEPVYVTVTPTVYVTAGSVATSCNSSTVTMTTTEIATITVPAAAGGIGHGSY